MGSKFFLLDSFGHIEIDTPSDNVLKKFNSNLMEMIVFNVGKGEAILVKNNKRAIFVDGGETNSKTRVRLGNALRQYLCDNNIKLNAIVASHNHQDHLNALSTMLKEKKILARGAKYYHNGESTTKSLTATLEKRLKELERLKKIKKIEIKNLKKIKWNVDQKITMFIDNKWEGRSDYKSIFMNIPFGETVFLLTGDVDMEYETHLVNDSKKSELLETDVLKITHHGSEHGTGEDLLKKSNPILYVSSSAEDSGHQLELDVINRIIEFSPGLIYDTFLDEGDIIIRTDGESRRIQGESGVLFEIEIRKLGYTSQHKSSNTIKDNQECVKKPS